jgi:3-isopropylmalate/(R)-2-methylmalate dehydratase small subunit
MPELERIEARSGRGIVVRGNDIDTDQIIPARYMTSIHFAGLEKHVFHDTRFTRDGTPKDHPFNQAHYRGASILIVNRNFGCGSSREHAPQALMRWGIRAIVGESFAEIFFGNCVALGMPAVRASADDVASLMDAIELEPSQSVEVDLREKRVRWRRGSAAIQLPDSARHALLQGTWDALGVLLRAEDQIRATAARIPYIAGF